MSCVSEEVCLTLLVGCPRTIPNSHSQWLSPLLVPPVELTKQELALKASMEQGLAIWLSSSQRDWENFLRDF